MTRLAGLLALPLTLAAVLFLSLIALQALARGLPARARRLASTTLVVIAIYGVVLAAVSVASHERVLAPGQEKFLCDLDCDLALSVARVMPLPPARPGMRGFAVTLRARSDAARVVMHVPPLSVELMAGGVRYAPVSGRQVRIDMPLPPGARGDAVLRFEVPAQAQDLKLEVLAGGFVSRFAIGDENSWFHRHTLFALPEPIAAAAFEEFPAAR